jgi:hypothetical protein
MRPTSRVVRSRNRAPASPTPDPARRSARFPQDQRWINPMEMPTRWRKPVATTNPKLGSVRVAMKDRKEADD